MLIARLIADPANSEIGLEARLDALSAGLEAEGLKLAGAQMLESCSDVLELLLVSDDEAALRRVLDVHFPNSDVMIARDEFRVPGLFVSDMDSTMIGQECIDELGDFAGLKEKIADITERAMQGELDFESALREDFVAQVPLSHVGRAIRRVGQELRHGLGLRLQRDAVADTAGLVRPPARHHAGTAGRADGLRDVGAIEHHRLRRQPVHRRHPVARVPVRSHGVGPLLVGPQKEKIRFVAAAALSAQNCGKAGEAAGHRLHRSASGDHG